MNVALIGGMGRLKKDYERVGNQYGTDIRFMEKLCPYFKEKVSRADAIIVFTDKVSHEARNLAVAAGRESGIPIFMCHSCGVSSLRRCLENIRKAETCEV